MNRKLFHITIDEAGDVIDGKRRVAAVKELGEELPSSVLVVLGGERVAAIQAFERRNGIPIMWDDFTGQVPL